MKTTVELPDDLMRAIKVRAAEEGRSIKDLLSELLRTALGPARPKAVPKVRHKPLPTLKSKHAAPKGQEMTPERVAEVLWGSGEN